MLSCIEKNLYHRCVSKTVVFSIDEGHFLNKYVLDCCLVTIGSDNEGLFYSNEDKSG